MKRIDLAVAAAARRLSPLGPLALPALFVLVAALLWTLSRGALVLSHFDRMREVVGWLRIFPVGWRMDSIQACYFLVLPTLVLLALPERGLRRARPALVGYFTIVLVLAVFLEIASFPFVEQYDARPNRIFLDYLKYPKEVFRMLGAEYKLPALVALVAMAAVARWARIAFREAFDAARPWPTGRRLAVLPAAVVVLFLGARGTLAHRPANISTAAFSSDHLANQLALNSSNSLFYAIYSLKHESRPDALYGRMDEAEMIARVRRASLLPDGEAIHPELPTLHAAPSLRPRSRPLNLVIFLQESLDAAYSAELGGLGVTPELDRLSREGLFFTRLYATGTRTVRGIEAIVSGYPPSPSASIVRLDGSQSGFFTLATLLRRRGYLTEFVYGGESNFDNMRSFLLGNGFDVVHDEPTFGAAELRGTWGVSDGDLVRKANELFRSHGEKPFFALMLSTSNHTPFEFPDGHIELFEQPKATARNAVKYADWAIGELFRLAKTEDYFRNTIFLVVADHDGRVFGGDIMPVGRFHIPGLILGPDVPVGRFDALASQIDLAPTLIDLLGLDAVHPMIGHDLLRRPADHPGRVLLQQDQNHGYFVGDQVVIHQPHKAPEQFTWKDGRLHPARLDPELARDALAHALLPGWLYRKRAWRLPDEETGRP